MSYDVVIGWGPYKTDFRGHEITMLLRPLKSWASILLTPIYIKTEEKAGEREKAKAKEEKAKADGKKLPPKKLSADDLNFSYEIQKAAEKILPDHVKDISGITINKIIITVKDICEETAFATLSMDILSELTARSQLDEQEVKNLKGPSGTPTNADEATQEP